MTTIDVRWVKPRNLWIVKQDGVEKAKDKIEEVAILAAIRLADQLRAAGTLVTIALYQPAGKLAGSLALSTTSAPVPGPTPIPVPPPEPVPTPVPPPEPVPVPVPVPTPVPPPPSGWVSRVVLEPDNPTCKVGEKIKFTPTYYDAAGVATTFDPTKWELDPRPGRSEFGSIDANGLFTALKATGTLTFKVFASYLPLTQIGQAAYDNVIVTILQADGTPAPIPTPVPVPVPTPVPTPGPLPTPVPGSVEAVRGPAGWPLGTVWSAVMGKIQSLLAVHLAACKINGGTMESYDANYYDLGWLLYILGGITGDNKWLLEGDKIVKWYIDDYLAPNGYATQPHLFQGRGLEIYFLRSGYQSAKAAILESASRNQYSMYTDAELGWDHYGYWIGNIPNPHIENRWCSRSLRSLIAAHRTCGVDYSAAIAAGVLKVKNHLAPDGRAQYSQTSAWMDGSMLGTLSDAAVLFKGTVVETNARAAANKMIPWIRSKFDATVNHCWAYDSNAGDATIDYGAVLNSLVLAGVTCWTVADRTMIEQALQASINESAINISGKQFCQVARALAVGSRVATGVVT